MSPGDTPDPAKGLSPLEPQGSVRGFAPRGVPEAGRVGQNTYAYLCNYALAGNPHASSLPKAIVVACRVNRQKTGARVNLQLRAPLAECPTRSSPVYFLRVADLT